MKTEDNKSLMRLARESLKGKWGLAVGGMFIFCLVSAITEAIWVGILVAGPLMGGLAIFSLAISRKQEVKLEQLFQGFNNFGKFLGAYWLTILFVLLWSLLFVIPGIVAAFSYAMVFFIIADDSSIGVSEALKKSKVMMKGYKWKYFCLSWRFFGWAILSVLSCGIGFLWLFPYMQISFAKFYEDLKAGQKFNTQDADV